MCNDDVADRYIRAAFLALLNREPDPSGLSHYKRRIARGEGFESVLDSITSGKEYRRFYPGTPNRLARKLKRLLRLFFRPGTRGATLLALNQSVFLGELRADRTALLRQLDRMAKDQHALNLRLLSIEEALSDANPEVYAQRLTAVEEALKALSVKSEAATQSRDQRLTAIDNTLTTISARAEVSDRVLQQRLTEFEEVLNTRSVNSEAAAQSRDHPFTSIEDALQKVRARVEPAALSDVSSGPLSNNLLPSPREAISSEAEDALLKLITLLRPLELKSADLIRVGGYKDGAYVMADTFASADAAVSLGVGADVSWDCAIADRGIPIWQYDHSVEQPEQCKGPPFTFDKRKVAVEARSKEEITLKEIFEIEGLRDKRNIILKIDIEGDEWIVLGSLPYGYLSRVNQLIVEFHNFQNAWHREWSARGKGLLRRLRTVFTPIHLHGNNCSGFCQLGGITFPRAVEVSFVKSSENMFGQPIQSIPHAELDAPNNPDFSDLRFRF